MNRASVVCAAFLLFACGSSPSAPSAPSAAAPPEAPPATPVAAAPTAATSPADEEVRDVCKKVMLQTRACGDLYVPALVRTRARFDQPPGIAARIKAEGEAKIIPIAREEFKSDWSDAGIASHCDKLVQMPEPRRKEVLDRERSCLPVGNDCAKFVDCNMENLARKWTPAASPSATAAPPAK